MKKLCLIALISLLAVGVYAQQSTKTLSVTTFSNTSGVKDFQWLNTALSDMLTTDLGASKHLTVVQRNRLGELLKEQEFQASGIVDEKSAVAAGKIIIKLIFDTIKYINQTEGVTIFLVEQNARMALQASTTGSVLETGNIVLQDSSQALLEDPRVRAAYLGE